MNTYWQCRHLVVDFDAYARWEVVLLFAARFQQTEPQLHLDGEFRSLVAAADVSARDTNSSVNFTSPNIPILLLGLICMLETFVIIKSTLPFKLKKQESDKPRHCDVLCLLWSQVKNERRRLEK